MKATACFALVIALGALELRAGDSPREQPAEQSSVGQRTNALKAQTLQGPKGRVGATAFSPDGRILAGGTSYPAKRDGVVWLWDTGRGNTARALALARGKFPFDEVYSLTFSPDGRRVAAGGGVLYHGAVAVWDAASGKELWQVWDVAPVAGVPIAFAPDGRVLANGGGGQRDTPVVVELRDAGTGKVTRTFGGCEHAISGLAFSPDGKILAGGEWGGVVRLWEVHSGELIRTLRLAPDTKSGQWPIAIAFAPSGEVLAAGGGSLPVRLWDLKNRTWVRTIMPGSKERNVRALAFSPDGKALAVGSWKAGVTLFDTTTGAEQASFFKQEGRAEAVAFSPDGKRLAIGCADGLVRILPLSGAP
jgi:WD40 repeat protein